MVNSVIQDLKVNLLWFSLKTYNKIGFLHPFFAFHQTKKKKEKKNEEKNMKMVRVRRRKMEKKRRRKMKNMEQKLWERERILSY